MRQLPAFLLLLVTACGGGGGGGPAAPQPPTPAPAPALVFAGSEPPAGATVTLTRTPPRNGREGLTWRVRATWPTAMVVQVHSLFFDGQGRECASAFSENAVLQAGIATEFTTSSLLVASACPMPFTTTRLQTTLWRVSGRVDNSATDHGAGWTFVDGGDVGGPGPQPSAAPTPPPTGGIPACPGSRPSASCGLATGRCGNGELTCSQNRSGTCSSNGGLACVWCPGPLC